MIGLKDANCDFAPKILNIGESPTVTVILTEKLSMDLQTMFDTVYEKHMSVYKATEFILFMMHCVLGLHELGFVHNDIKPENFLINKSKNIVVSDFGLTQSYKDESGHQTHFLFKKKKKFCILVFFLLHMPCYCDIQK